MFLLDIKLKKFWFGSDSCWNASVTKDAIVKETFMWNQWDWVHIRGLASNLVDANKFM